MNAENSRGAGSEQTSRRGGHVRRRGAVIAVLLAAAVLAGAALGLGGGRAGFAVALAEYPEMPALPNEEEFFDPETGVWDGEAYDRQYTPWWEAQRARWKDRPEDYAAGLEGFFAAGIRQFLGDAEGENRVCSPVNLCMSLAILAELTGGESRQQILDLLAQPDLQTLRAQAAAIWRANYCDDGGTTSVLANSLWLNQGVSFVPSTLETLARDYRASSYQGEMGSEDFDQALRDWVNQQTGGLLEAQSAGLRLDPDTVLALASTVYFRAKWQDEFSESGTAPQTFHSPAGDLTCDFLHESDSGFYFWGERFSAVSRHLENYGGTMWFLLPDEGVTAEELLEDPQVMEFLLMNAKWENWSDNKCLIINLALPKFDVSSDLDLLPGLRALGITDVFDPSASDFSPMAKEAEGIRVSQAEHAARVAIDEEGVAAAAYTVMPAPGAGMPPEEEVDFVLDRPFLFAITGEDGLPLFAGLVNRPV